MTDDHETTAPSLAVVAAEFRLDGTPRQGVGPRPNLARVEEAERLWLARRPTAEIARELAERFGCTERTIESDLARIRAAWAVPPERREELRDQHRAYLVNLLEQAHAADALELCRRIAADLAKLDGLDAPSRLAVDARVTGVLTPSEMTSSGRRARIAELLEKAGRLAGHERPGGAPGRTTTDDEPSRDVAPARHGTTLLTPTEDDR